MNLFKILITILVFQLSNDCNAQFVDDFSDGSILTNPIWQGDNGKFITSSGKLKLQAPLITETAFLSTPSRAIHEGSWEFYLQMDFTPSSTNYAKIYLVGDQPDLKKPLNGYFIKAGNTSRDVSLYRQTGLIESKIIDGLDDRINLSAVKARIKVTRVANGLWQLYSDVGTLGSYALEGSSIDNTHTVSSYFGIHFIYTSTRADKFWLDDVVVQGSVVPDTKPPEIVTAVTLNDHQAELQFSEQLSHDISISDFYIDPSSSPSSVLLKDDQQTILLDFSLFTNGVSYRLHASGVKDLAGNSMIPVVVNVLYFKEILPKRKDIIFTEIFPDPSPQLGLPNAEFIELYNRSNKPFNLSGWELSDGSSTGIFPDQIILPGEYWIVAASSAAGVYNSFGKVIGLNNFPTLNNALDSLTLKSRDGLTIDSIQYTLEWYRDVDKQDGGWSLELIDPTNPCGDENNWMAAEIERGGTPGKQNSVYASKPDLTPPQPLLIFPESATLLSITFNEVLAQPAPSIAHFLVDENVGIRTVSFKDRSLKNLSLTLNHPLSPGAIHKIRITDVQDCNGNYSSAATFEFGLPEKADSLDIVINEILFNPRNGGVDFIELYNRSPKFLNLNDWKVGNISNDHADNIFKLSSANILMPPGAFFAFTSDIEILKSQYPRNQQVQMLQTTLPGLPDDKGSVIILDPVGRRLDAVAYSKDWHSKFIKDDEGVSLERISDALPGADFHNWTSASSLSGFATPGAVNSQSRVKVEVEDDVVVIPEIFSPAAGTAEFAQIAYHFNESAWIGNVKIFSPEGHLIKKIADNVILGLEGSFRWDGDREDSTRARMGYYFVWFEIYNDMGIVRTFRKRVILSSHD